MQKEKLHFSTLLREALGISGTLFKIIIPVSILTKILTDLGLTQQCGRWLSPVMEIVGLPGDLGLVWATAMFTNLYAGMVVLSALGPSFELTVSQVTTLCTLMLVAHSLPVELRIVQLSGCRIWLVAGLRLLGAFVLGWMLFKIYSIGGFLQGTHVTLWVPVPQDPTWSAWLLSEVKKLVSIFLIVTTLLVVLRLVDSYGGVNILTKVLGPPLSLLGMSATVVPIIIVSMTLGLSYGGGLIIKESKEGQIKKRDIFCALALMSLCHSIVEDTALMLLVGGHLSGIIFGRVFFSIAVIFLLAKTVALMSDAWFFRFCFKSDP